MSDIYVRFVRKVPTSAGEGTEGLGRMMLSADLLPRQGDSVEVRAVNGAYLYLSNSNLIDPLPGVVKKVIWYYKKLPDGRAEVDSVEVVLT